MTSATVVGSGPNGMAAAIRLAQAGISTTVLEAADTPGGGVRTSELTVPGVLHDDCAAAMPGALASPFFRELHLERHGLTWLHHGTVAAHPLHGGEGATMVRDLETTAAGLGADGAAWRRMFGPLVRNADAVFDTVFAPPLAPPQHPGMLPLLGIRAMLPVQVLATRFRTEAAAALFGGIAAHLFADFRSLGSASAAAMLTTAAHTHGWPIPRGGAGQLTAALIAELSSLGGRLETGRTVSSTAELDTDLVLLTVPPRTALRMVAGLPERTRRAWTRFRPGPGAFKVDLAIDGDLPWTDPGAHGAGVVHLGGTLSQIATAEADCVAGRMPEVPFVLVAQPHRADPTRSRGSINPVWLYAHVPQGWPTDETARVLDILESYAPGARAQIVGMHVRGPAALERHNAADLGGDIGGGANTIRQLLARPRWGANGYRSGVAGVYLAGSSTSPGGGVHGMSGVHAAETAIADLTRGGALNRS